LPEGAWPPGAEERGGVVREWADGASVPRRAVERKDPPPDRDVAIRIRQTQGRLVGDGTPVQHCAVVRNDGERDGRPLLEWQRGKAGTVAHVNRVRKDALAAGV
jgi:hypothetical protein